MGEFKDYTVFSEEKTEPFSQSEIEARLQSSRMEELSNAVIQNSTVSLDQLLVPDPNIRILMRPLTRTRSVSPGNHDSCKWLALHAEVADNLKEQSQHKVLAVTQTPQDIKFSVRIPVERLDDASPRSLLWCELYYDPASDNQILVNRSEVPFILARASQQSPGSPGGEYELNPNSNKALTPGTWRIKVGEAEVLDFRVLEKRPARLVLPASPSSEVSSLSDTTTSSGKRSFVADDEEPLPGKKARATEATGKKDDGVIMFLPKTSPLVFPLPTAAKESATGKEVATFNGHPLLDMEQDQTVAIPSGCELDKYTIIKRNTIASTGLSSVFTAEHSGFSTDGYIVVKVLKTRSSNPANNEGPAAGRNVIQQADMWLREFQTQENLEHDSIVRLYGGDARYLSLYMEHVNAPDLAAKAEWRSSTDFFAGDRSDAERILRDIAGALHYIHGRGLVHNDIKPGNILYSPERGAVLCDLGLSTHVKNPPSNGGTPYYIPPEFIGFKHRGAPGDVWALGVTMLYVLGKIPFPESRAHKEHPRRLFWLIAKVNNARDSARPYAVAQMQQWLSEVNATRAKLNTKDKLERLVHDMLSPNPAQRIRMHTVMNELFGDAER
ncbi:CAMK protein kinase [Diplogelasinospora grovesii]|uniref:CAMK protein kinase n=1 Tax=Diplogelasinospora grovesii TaxID=303347 RepID=A0AAN6N2Y0_9PEZI|nr:CAMK protein kinase [Diplogelasinospora grovesii]